MTRITNVPAKNRRTAIFLVLTALMLILGFQNCSIGSSAKPDSSSSQPFTLISPTENEASQSQGSTAGENGNSSGAGTTATSPTPTAPKKKCEIVQTSGGPEVVSWASPMRHRVYQRQGTVADVAISVTLSGSAECLQLRVLNADNSVRVEWTEFTNNTNFRLPHGGWYAVQIRAIAGNKTGKVAVLDHVGIGDVYITAGQSNSVFYGESPQKTASGRVSYFDGTDWTICQDALQRITPGAPGGAPWCLLGDIMVANYNVPIAFAPVGWPGTTISQWQKNAGSSPGASGELYARMIRTVKYFGPYGLRGMLWHQGESDVGITDTETYKNSLFNLIVGSREEGGYPLKWFVSRATYPWDWSIATSAAWQAVSYNGDPVRIQAVEAARVSIRQGQELTVGNDVNAVYLGPDTDMAGTAYRYQELHFSNQGLASVAQAWFNAIHPVIAR